MDAKTYKKIFKKLYLQIPKFYIYKLFLDKFEFLLCNHGPWLFIVNKVV